MDSVRGIEDIGENFMLDIFSRLDLKELIYCKCVCKTWRELVLDPYLVNILWSKNKTRPSLMIHDLKFSERGDLNWIEIQEEEEILDTERIHNVDLYAPGVIKGYPGFPNILTLVGGSIDGLICLWDLWNGTYIINPIANECMTLPQAHSSLSYTNLAVISYGFGVSKGANEYKVIRICDLNASGSETQVEIEVYTLGTNRWRTLQPQDHYNNVGHYMTSGFFFDGRLHWINVCGRCELFVFELDKETFNLFPSPPPVYEHQAEKINHSTLGVLKGCLSQYCWYPSFQFSVWVMREYGIKDSWYKAFTLKDTNIAPQLSDPLCLIDGPKGGLLIVRDYEDSLAAYCLQTNKLKRVNLSSKYPNRRVRIVTTVTYRPTFLKLQNFASPDAVVHAF